jgi:hypothetical protein
MRGAKMAAKFAMVFLTLLLGCGVVVLIGL